MKIWKKGVIVTLAVCGVLLLAVSVSAGPPHGKPKPMLVKVSVVGAYDSVSKTVTFTATSPRRGSAFTDSWTGATLVGTTFNPAMGSYVSTATVDASTASSGDTFTAGYAITMTAGRSRAVTFSGAGAATVTIP